MARNLIDTDDMRKELATLKDDLAKVRQDVGDVVGAMVEVGRQSGSGVSDQVRTEVGKRLHDINNAYGRMRVTGVRTMRRAQQRAADHPVLTVLGAVLIGSAVASIAEWIWWRRR